MFKSILLISAIALLVTACGGSKEQAVPELNDIKMSLSPLGSSAETSFSQYYRNGLYMASSQYYSDVTLPSDGLVFSSAEGFLAEPFSGTIFQELGVREADRISYDGETLYIAGDKYYEDRLATDEKSNGDFIRIMRRQAGSGMTPLTEIEFARDNVKINGLYLNENTLSVQTREPTFIIPVATTGSWAPSWQKFGLSFYNVAEPQQPALLDSLSIDGYIISSRQIGDKLYVVSRFFPFIDGLIAAPKTEKDLRHNYDLINNIDINDLLPKYTRQDGEQANLVTADNCIIPTDATRRDGHNTIVTLTTIDVNNPQQLQSICVNSEVRGVYSSTESIYLYGSDFQRFTQQSVIHKFSIDSKGIHYAASGQLDGGFGWGQSHLRFNENDNYLRVVNTRFNDNGQPEHRLSIFESLAANNQLQLVSQLPNDDQPAAIGKENEDIYAVRFFADRAYVVTFFRQDPLYVIDLKDPKNPAIAGELEIPGYSAYLHPISENLLLGIGQQVNRTNLPVAGGNDSVSNNIIEQGAKVTLFDVSNPHNPLEVNSIIFLDGYTPVEYDYHGLTYLKQSENKHLFALPIEQWNVAAIASQVARWTPESSLELLEVNITGTNAQLNSVGSVTPKADDSRNYIGAGDDRSIIHGDDIYYIHGNRVWHSQWSAPDDVTGPY